MRKSYNCTRFETEKSDMYSTRKVLTVIPKWWTVYFSRWSSIPNWCTSSFNISCIWGRLGNTSAKRMLFNLRYCKKKRNEIDSVEAYICRQGIPKYLKICKGQKGERAKAPKDKFQRQIQHKKGICYFAPSVCSRVWQRSLLCIGPAVEQFVSLIRVAAIAVTFFCVLNSLQLRDRWGTHRSFGSFAWQVSEFKFNDFVLN